MAPECWGQGATYKRQAANTSFCRPPPNGVRGGRDDECENNNNKQRIYPYRMSPYTRQFLRGGDDGSREGINRKIIPASSVASD